MDAIKGRSVVDVGLFDPDDDANETRIAATFQELVDGTTSPASAAKIVDEVITRECTEALSAYKTQSSAKGPSPAGWQKFVYDCIAKAAMKVPSSHQGQDDLVHFLDELSKLPQHRVPALYRNPERFEEKQLWILNRENGYDGFGQWMWDRHEGMFSSGLTGESSDAYINFSAFLARLLGQGTAALLNLSALLPFAKRNIASLTVTQTPAFELVVAAAAQWILHAGATLHEMCRRKILAELRWKPVLWDNIKNKFDTVARGEAFEEAARNWARQAANRMLEIESEAPSGPLKAKQGAIVDAHAFPEVKGADDDEAEDDLV